ncbi:hypothetical protein I4U23_005446 [Adineta vaga]|nr:hypothetical protein I4U23_005446 [Adineta vaga]
MAKPRLQISRRGDVIMNYNNKDYDRQGTDLVGVLPLNSDIDPNTNIINNNGYNNTIKISNHAFNYACEYHFTPFQIIYPPKTKDTKQGSKLINELIKSIKEDFMLRNPSFNKPFLFDL